VRIALEKVRYFFCFCFFPSLLFSGYVVVVVVVVMVGELGKGVDGAHEADDGTGRLDYPARGNLPSVYD
jgi:hypothetical protein